MKNRWGWPGSISRPATINKSKSASARESRGGAPATFAFFPEKEASAQGWREEQRMDSYKSGIGTGTVSSHVHNPVSRIERKGGFSSKKNPFCFRRKKKKRKREEREKRNLRTRGSCLAMWEGAWKEWGVRERDTMSFEKGSSSEDRYSEEDDGERGEIEGDPRRCRVSQPFSGQRVAHRCW